MLVGEVLNIEQIFVLLDTEEEAATIAYTRYSSEQLLILSTLLAQKFTKEAHIFNVSLSKSPFARYAQMCFSHLNSKMFSL